MHEVRVPGDKSISHRALIFAALASGRSRIRRILPSHDIHSTAAVLRALGVAVPQLSADLEFDGVELHGLKKPASDLDCGNSGTTARLMTGVAAACPFDSRFVGDASLSKRPMRRVTGLLERMGASFTFEKVDGLPMIVHGGQLTGIEYVNERASAQIKSALLLAGLVSSATVRVVEPRPSRDHTERMLRAQGANLVFEPGLATIANTERLQPLDLEVPGDPSSAAFIAAYAALLGNEPISIPEVCLNPTRTGFLDVLGAMGADVRMQGHVNATGEDVGTIEVHPGALRAVHLTAERIPALVDELPLVAVLAARANGETIVEGAEELRLKESDRIHAIVHNLRAVGAEAEELPDGFVVRGSSRQLAGRVTTHGDHRIAMAFGVLGAVHGNAIQVDDAECVAVSYPGFWQQLTELGGTVH